MTFTLSQTTALLLLLPALLLPSCSSLSLNERPRRTSPIVAAQQQSSPSSSSSPSILSSWGQKAKELATVSVLGASLMFGAGSLPPLPANAAPPQAMDTTRVELTVETDYFVKVLGYFDGDMKKTLGALVRSPFSTVQIDPADDKSRDALLRALYSYSAPEYYVEQAQWLNIAPKKSFVEDFLDAKYRVTLPSPDGEKREIKFSNFELSLVAAVLSYPVTFGLYKYENYKEEQNAIAKRAAIAAKKAAAAAKAAPKAKEEPATTTTNAAPVPTQFFAEVATPIKDPEAVGTTEGGMDDYAAQLAAMTKPKP